MNVHVSRTNLVPILGPDSQCCHFIMYGNVTKPVIIIIIIFI